MRREGPCWRERQEKSESLLPGWVAAHRYWCMTSTTFDLTALRRACVPVLSWYEGFLAERRLDLQELDEALAALRRLPPVGGRLGRALDTLAAGGVGSSTEEVLICFEVLRCIPGLQAQAPTLGAVLRPMSAQGPAPQRSATQPRLPGFF